MDILDDILGTLDLRGLLYFRTDFSPPWSVQVPTFEQAARFHLVIQGSCHVTLDNGRAEILGPGDLILIPRGMSHILADAPGHAAPSLESVLQDAGYDGNGPLVLGDGDPAAASQMVCGHFTFRNGAEHPLLKLLPDHILLSAGERARQPWLDDILRLITRQIFSEEPGSGATVTRLSEIMFIELLRTGIGQRPELTRILEGFGDSQIGRALGLLHERPEESWTVERLALAVGMSRSRFAERFNRMIGCGPMAYLNDWRLQKALALLEDSRSPVSQVANMTGYQSPASFSRAFSGKFGIAPTEFRKNLQ